MIYIFYIYRIYQKAVVDEVYHTVILSEIVLERRACQHHPPAHVSSL
jgi:hypothetical protein